MEIFNPSIPGHEAPTISIYSTIYLWIYLTLLFPGMKPPYCINVFYTILTEIFNPSIPGHEAPPISMYSTIHLWKYLTLLFPGMMPLLYQCILQYNYGNI
jgi:hypothetical protein